MSRSALSKDEWLDVIASKLADFGITLIDRDRAQLRGLAVRQLATIENLIGLLAESSCRVGCGSCETCRAANARKEATP